VLQQFKGVQGLRDSPSRLQGTSQCDFMLLVISSPAVVIALVLQGHNSSSSSKA
jgi:hypothetical protein